MHEVLIYGNIKCGFLQILVGLCGFKRARHLTKQENQMDKQEKLIKFTNSKIKIENSWSAIPVNLIKNKNITDNEFRILCYFLSENKNVHETSNAELCEIYGINIRTSKRLISSLNKKKFIIIETDKSGVHWQRKIHLNLDVICQKVGE